MVDGLIPVIRGEILGSAARLYAGLESRDSFLTLVAQFSNPTIDIIKLIPTLNRPIKAQ